jgi:Fe-S cluster biosynthesis and repair protein YggX
MAYVSRHTQPRRERAMARMVHCKKLGRELPGMTFKPFPNELGQRIYENISQEAWKMWLEHFKMVMNEFRLSPADPRTNQVLFEQAEQFFFGAGAQLPPDFVPPPSKG